MVAVSTVHDDPSGPVTLIGSEGSITASSKVSVTFPGAADNAEPSAGSLL